MCIHTWKGPGPGESIDGDCSVKKFTISEMTDDYAEGEITIIDHIENGITFTDPWEASRSNERWKVERRDNNTSAWEDPNTGKLCFTLNGAVNASIKSFIVGRIIVFLETKQVMIGPIEMSESDRKEALGEGKLFKVSDSFLFAAQIPDDSVGCSGSRCSNCHNKTAYCNQRCLWCGFPFVGPSGFPQFPKWSALSPDSKMIIAANTYRSSSSRGRLGYSNVEFVPLTKKELESIEELNKRDAAYFLSTHSISHKEIKNTLFD